VKGIARDGLEVTGPNVASKPPRIVFKARGGDEGTAFPLGRVVATPGALRLLTEAGAYPFDYLARHATGDWGNLCAFDRRQNEIALREGYRVLSSYDVSAERVWIITEADRSVTTILLPEEY
jgi:hypothetical protein